jgi:hypothetical protein
VELGCDALSSPRKGFRPTARSIVAVGLLTATPFIRRVSMQIAGNPAARSSVCSQSERGPASSPTRVIVNPVATSHRTRSSGSDAAFGDDNSILVNDTDSGLVERDIQAGEILHETLPMMAGPANYCCRSASLEAAVTTAITPSLSFGRFFNRL